MNQKIEQMTNLTYSQIQSKIEAFESQPAYDLEEMLSLLPPVERLLREKRMQEDKRRAENDTLPSVLDLF
jgi:exoribonuclease R